MPVVDPKARFWIGVLVTAAILISGGTVHLTNAIPAAWIPAATAWCSIIAGLGSAFLTALNAMASTTQSRIASAASLPDVSQIVTSRAVADASPSDKVVAPPASPIPVQAKVP